MRPPQKKIDLLTGDPLVNESKRAPGQDPASGESQKRRIETQIHRRKKVKAVLPLEAEWDARSNRPPVGLRMPSDKMNKTQKFNE